MVARKINEHIVCVDWDEDKAVFEIYVDGVSIGATDTTAKATEFAGMYIKAIADRAEMLKVKLDNGAIVPVRAHATDAGLDLKTPMDITIGPGDTGFVDTGVHVQIPSGYFGLVTSKSGLMKKKITARGTIDSDYRGSIGIVVFNHGNTPYEFKAGEKVAQLVLIPCITPGIELVDKLEETERGDGGFGSTGK